MGNLQRTLQWHQMIYSEERIRKPPKVFPPRAQTIPLQDHLKPDHHQLVSSSLVRLLPGQVGMSYGLVAEINGGRQYVITGWKPMSWTSILPDSWVEANVVDIITTCCNILDCRYYAHGSFYTSFAFSTTKL